MKIFISTSSFGKYDRLPLEKLKNHGFDILMNPYGSTMKKSQIQKFIKDKDGLIAGTESITEGVLKSAKQLKVISRCGAGLDNIDLTAAKIFGIKVFNTPDAPTTAVAELTVALMLNLLRKVSLSDYSLKNGRWEKQMGNLIYRKRIGIIGYGRIGKKVSELLKPFNCIIKYTDPFLKNIKGNSEYLSLRQLLSWADIISIHVSTGEEIIGKKEIGFIKKGAWLLNLSRGSVVNENALYKAVDSRYLSGAALDVFRKEPYDGPLKKLANVVLTPHIGSYAKESRVEMELEAVHNLLEGLGLT